MESGARGSAATPSESAVDPRAVLQAMLGDTGRQPNLASQDLRRSLVASLTAEDSSVRLSSSWAITLLADDQPESIPGLVRRLLDTIDASHDVRGVLATLHARHPDRVQPELDASGIDPADLSSQGEHGSLPLSFDDDSLARTIEELQDALGTEFQDATGQQTTDSTDTPPASSRQRKRDELREIEASDTFRAIRAQSRFDDAEVVLPRDGGRYADTIRVRAIEDGTERGVALGLLDRPEDVPTTRPGPSEFADDVGEQLARWQGASATQGVVTVHDWARTPRPWLATEPVEKALVEWDPPGVGARLRCGLAIAKAVASCHRQGVVHAGLDPGNVVFAADTLAEEPQPLLTNVGLLLALRNYVQPADYLDPRFAAPEYFDDSYGGIDHSTDVYQLGTVLYQLCTGRAPYQGTFEEVRDGVLDGTPPAPTACTPALPDPIDDVIEKATATQKIVRYETASQVQSALRRICNRVGVDTERRGQ